MKHNVELLAERLTAVLASWPSVECVLSCEAAETDVIDPYFALVLDVYCDGDMPDDAARQAAFGDPGAFESSHGREKDRFFLDGLPIRLEYKNRASVDAIIDGGFRARDVIKGQGSYLFHRLGNGTVLYSKSAWIDRVRAGLGRVPAALWKDLREAEQFRMEHSLSDLGGAALKDDRFFYYVSLAGFMRACVSVLFALNRQWEPSDRHMTELLFALPVLPEDFNGRWGLLTRTDGSVGAEKKYQVAQLITRSIFALA